MKKNQLLVALLSVVATFYSVAMALAAPISAEAALGHARAFVAQHGKHKAKGQQSLTLAFTIDRPVSFTSERRSMLYAYNLSGGGFVIASGDDAAYPILGYGDGAEALSLSSMPDNMRAWLEGYADEMACAQQVGYPSAVNYTHLVIGNELKARLRLVNKGSVAYQHEVKATLKKNYWNEVSTLTQQVNIPAYGEQTLEFDFTGTLVTRQ